MLKTFLQFINEKKEEEKKPQSQNVQSQDVESQDPTKSTLFIIGDIGYDSPDVQWFITLDIKDIWEEYQSKSIDFNEFVKKYKDKITEKKSELQKISETCWYDIKEIMDQSGEYDDKKSNKYFNRIYDWADEHGIKIDTGIKPEIQNDESQNIESQPQPQNNDTIQ